MLMRSIDIVIQSIKEKAWFSASSTTYLHMRLHYRYKNKIYFLAYIAQNWAVLKCNVSANNLSQSLYSRVDIFYVTIQQLNFPPSYSTVVVN